MTGNQNKYIANGFKNLIWDFNGTLLNDLSLCVDSINQLLGRRQLEHLSTQNYLDIFTFPVQDYYKTAGFDFEKEPYETVAIEFMELYLNGVNKSPLHDKVIALLSSARDLGFRQIILSAMEITELKKLAKNLEIEGYFENIFGIDNHLAAGKSYLAKHAMETSGFKPEETCLIGDTLHDAEVADHIGIQCILVASGHQSADRLRKSGHTVVGNHAELLSLLKLN